MVGRSAHGMSYPLNNCLSWVIPRSSIAGMCTRVFATSLCVQVADLRRRPNIGDCRRQFDSDV